MRQHIYSYISCSGVDCGQLKDIPNGQVDISPDTKFGSYATYSCNLGHVLQGNQQRICQADGQWSGSTPRCVRKLRPVIFFILILTQL